LLIFLFKNTVCLHSKFGIPIRPVASIALGANQEPFFGGGMRLWDKVPHTLYRPIKRESSIVSSEVVGLGSESPSFLAIFSIVQ